ncbi:hypothetical protein PV08_06575 [Exophiala spinifera]|uniref:DUF3669 domain-containing protein n=1 Tax=Exophiala spinifera TaxID=91928 RepID=A0A0D2BD61_9EURO|nr:uncharacterized protein PV08_06575 [Exophiala spinifera]KIW16520.1 hypothetical protein PV08_06575 [Exophiala spinifera]
MARRRFIASSSDYEPPMTTEFEEDLTANLRLLSLLENPSSSPSAQSLPEPQQKQIELARMLSIKSVISTTSSFAEEQSKANESSVRTFRKIGAGACGIVFTVDGQSLSYKIGKTLDDDDALFNDYTMHQTIKRAVRQFSTEIEIPDVYGIIERDDTKWWNEHHDLYTTARDVVNLPAPVVITERILPLPAPTRTQLINHFCRENLQQSAKADSANKDCLVRPYLGSMKGRKTAFFSLRNFKLHLNQMIDIGLDYEMLAVSMGEVLAIMHWRAQTDARDIELVLGSSTTNTNQEENDGPSSENFVRRETRLFILDFNQVRKISMDDTGVADAVDAFFLNDPYYPRPCESSRVQQELWNSFVRSYLNTADTILGGHQVLQRKFIAEVISRTTEKRRVEAKE